MICALCRKYVAAQWSCNEHVGRGPELGPQLRSRRREKTIVDNRSARTVLDITIGLKHRNPHQIVVVINSVKRDLSLKKRSFRCSKNWAQAVVL